MPYGRCPCALRRGHWWRKISYLFLALPVEQSWGGRVIELSCCLDSVLTLAKTIKKNKSNFGFLQLVLHWLLMFVLITTTHWSGTENRSSGPMVMPHRAHWCPMPWGGYRWGNREERHREVKQQEVTEAELQPGSLLPLSILCTVLRFWDGTQEWTLAQEVRWCLHVISAALGGTLSWAWVSS